MLTSVSAWEVTIAVVPSARLCHLCFELRKLTRTAASSRILVFLLLFLASCDFNSSTMQCYSSTISCTMSSALCTCHNMTVVTSMIISHLTSHKSACSENDDSVITAELEFFHQLRVWQFNHLGSKKRTGEAQQNRDLSRPFVYSDVCESKTQKAHICNIISFATKGENLSHCSLAKKKLIIPKFWYNLYTYFTLKLHHQSLKSHFSCKFHDAKWPLEYTKFTS